MEIRHLKYFVAVAEELHFGRAAARLHTSQPSLSQQIRSFEDELGLPLFTRTSRRVQLTAAGDALLQDARRILEELSRSVDNVRSVADGSLGEFRIGFAASSAYSFLPHAISSFRAKTPGVGLRLEELTTPVQITSLLERRIDLGIARDAPPTKNIEVLYRRSERLVVALPPGHPLAGARRALFVKELSNEPFIVPPRPLSPGFHSRLMTVCHAAGFTPRVELEAIQFSTIAMLAAAGLGVAILPETTLLLQHPQLTWVELEDKLAFSELMLIKRTDSDSPIVERFLDTVGAEFGIS